MVLPLGRSFLAGEWIFVLVRHLSMSLCFICTSRKALNKAQVHRAPMKGIVGNTNLGAFSVVVNDGYEDDIDEGDVM